MVCWPHSRHRSEQDVLPAPGSGILAQTAPSLLWQVLPGSAYLPVTRSSPQARGTEAGFQRTLSCQPRRPAGEAGGGCQAACPCGWKHHQGWGWHVGPAWLERAGRGLWAHPHNQLVQRHPRALLGTGQRRVSEGVPGRPLQQCHPVPPEVTVAAQWK